MREKPNQFSIKNVFKMDETRLLYKLQSNHFFVQNNLEAKKKTKKDLQLLSPITRKVIRKFLSWFINHMLIRYI